MPCTRIAARVRVRYNDDDDWRTSRVCGQMRACKYTHINAHMLVESRMHDFHLSNTIPVCVCVLYFTMKMQASVRRICCICSRVVCDACCWCCWCVRLCARRNKVLTQTFPRCMRNTGRSVSFVCTVRTSPKEMYTKRIGIRKRNVNIKIFIPNMCTF